MTEPLRVRLYNVRFGDAILLLIPDEDEAGQPVTRHVLFDVGNVLSGAGGSNAVYAPIFEDILATLNGRPLDLYVMTHAHLDHVEGPRYAAKTLGRPLRADTVWMTASEEGEAYYAKYPNARKQKKAFLAALDAIRPMAAAESSERLVNMLRNNDPRDHLTAAGATRAGTAACVEYIREEMGGEVHFVHRETDTAGKHPLRTAEIRILAPEADTSTYYGRPRPFQAANLGDQPVGATVAATPRPPAGVDAGAFYDLVRSREAGYPETLLAIDKAANNTSLVLEINWRGRRLLFAGDAELASWRRMLALGLLRPVDFLKVGHHGSHNGTPLADIEALLPLSGDRTRRHVAVSTCVGSYNGVPHDHTMGELGQRATVHDTRTVPDGAFIEIAL